MTAGVVLHSGTRLICKKLFLEKYDYEKAAATGLNEVREKLAIVLKHFVVRRLLSLRETAVSKAAAPLTVTWQQGAGVKVGEVLDL